MFLQHIDRIVLTALIVLATGIHLIAIIIRIVIILLIVIIIIIRVTHSIIAIEVM